MLGVEPKHFLALSARARCEAGEFKLCGQKLEPFSFRHVLQLEVRGNPLLLGNRDITTADVFEAAWVCAHPDFVSGMPEVSNDDLAGFDIEGALAIWDAYAEACLYSFPSLWEAAAKDSKTRAPYAEFAVTFIMRHTSGHTREGLYTAPVGEVVWMVESISEQLDPETPSRILRDKDKREMEQQKQGKGLADRKRREKTAFAITKAVRSGALRSKLLAQLIAGTLPKDWRKQVKA